jgi:beta-glucanase (GH16 family)
MTNTKSVNVLLVLPLLVLLLVCFSGSPQSTPSMDQARGRWRLVWSDEFDYAGLPDPKKWDYDVGGKGWGNKESQFYTARRKENARVENGHLIIEARRERWQENEYTSARLVTRNKGDWTYGRFEVRAKLPSGRGTWPAIWMLSTGWTYGGWPSSGEIDIMEEVGFDPDVVHASVHTSAYNHTINTQKTARIKVPNSRNEFNVYAVEWSPEEIRGFVNDQHYFTFRNERLTNPAADYRQWPFDKPFHLLLNLAVGGTWGGQQGVDPAIWPQRLVIDYVRVYELEK